jgi:hypothetical protein
MQFRIRREFRRLKPSWLRRRKNFVSEILFREDFVELAIQQASLITKDLKILEIGPYMSPLTSGTNVDTFDVLNYQQLVERAISENGPSHLIPNVTWVGPTASTKYIHSKYDLILSSHVVEHQVDLVAHFQNIETLLHDRGFYAALIPDHRYCFDHFNSPSTITDVFLAHFLEADNHSLKSFLDDRLTTGHNETLRYWKNDAGERKIIGKSYSEVRDLFREYTNLIETGTYVDVHGWKFTHSSFLDIFETLSKLKLTNLKVQNIYPAKFGNNEFWVLLQK